MPCVQNEVCCLFEHIVRCAPRRDAAVEDGHRYCFGCLALLVVAGDRAPLVKLLFDILTPGRFSRQRMRQKRVTVSPTGSRRGVSGNRSAMATQMDSLSARWR